MSLETFIQQNRSIIQFAYGLSFFVMGLAVALQSRSYSRLELSRSLAWLAAFGILHGIYTWGELFAPVNEAYLSYQGILLLHEFHLLLLAGSFLCLLEFGVALLRPLGKGQWIRWVGWGWFALYVVVVLGILPRLIADPMAWHATADAIARYTIGLTGGLLAAYALREQTYRLIAPLSAPHIVSMLRYTGIMLAIFALVGGLIPPPIHFFPGTVLNDQTFEQVTHIPVLVFLSLLGILLAFTVIRAMEIFQVETEHRIEEMEQQQILNAERERIGRELHDGTMQTVYTAGLLIDSARKLTEPETPVANRLDQAVMVLDEAIADMRRQLGELRTSPSGVTVAAALQELADNPRFRSLVDIRLKMEIDHNAQLPPRDSVHLLAIVNEALSNVIRHANAHHVEIRLQENDSTVRLAIDDDGTGLPAQHRDGYGLHNMQERARLLNGTLSVTGRSGRGTSVLLEFPRSP
jgi:signal transduction histidine kinase